MPHRPLARALTALTALLAATLGAAAAPGVAQAAQAAKPARAAAAINYVALGDSYSSGVGAGPYDLSTCLRSDKSYAPLWAAAHQVASFTFPACGGAVTADVINKQVSALSTSTTLVTITIGGNDAGFVDVITSCRFGSTSTCEGAVDEARTFATTELPGRLDRTYAAIREKAPNARLVVLGYPRLFETTSCGALAMSAYKRTIINEAADLLASVTAGRAAAAGATFADARPYFAGHGVCAAAPWIRDVTGVIEAYHPNADGYRLGYLPALTAVTG
ncbi:SGNH/GDSL hydrolase family protein [Micromonospora haikouensis]|uniref:GDSL-like Lipase/Acylhydrolase family protein n=1 Tax=Micromonospora haikouensis TaxID=686309 RepID=A0A1C4VJI7_9ACTN|nr:SGNH/GDSL hydrolase family protein [Micromonospora haikouensis]SCE83971.1 GDSL-like Lipase/Acylhydrolase family protein [Micromonospora haikouensis]